MIEAKTSEYWIASNALYITLNANGSPDYIVGNVVADAHVLCYIKGIEGLDYDAGHNYRRWPLSLSPTYFSTEEEKYVYIAIPRPSNPVLVAVVVFPSEKLDIYGKNESDEQIGSEEYYYIWTQGIISATNAGHTDDREWTQQVQTGTLSSDEAYDAGGVNPWWQYSTVDDTVTLLKEIWMDVASVFKNLKAEKIFLNSKELNDVVTSSASAPSDSNKAVVTPGYAAKMYISKVVNDTAAGRITFQQGLDAIGRAVFSAYIQSNGFEEGLYDGSGWKITNQGNAELESLRVRTYMEVVELLVNRMQAQEGETIFTDNDQIEAVEKLYDEEEGTSYLLTLKEKYDGYITTQCDGNVIKGIINTLAAEQAGVIDDQGANPPLYFTSWMKVVETHNTSGSELDVNQIRVVLYGDNDVPGGTNYAPCELMNIARWGSELDPEEQGISAAEKARRQRLRSTFYISTSDGYIAKLINVHKPKLDNSSYGTTLGELPNFVKQYSSVSARLQEGRDYLYAQGVVVEDFIKITREGNPIYEYVDCGAWVNGSSGTPSVGHGIYLYEEFNSVTGQYETHDVWHNNARWRVKQHQPVSVGGVDTYYEPSDANSAYWQKLEEGIQGKDAQYIYLKGDAKGASSSGTDGNDCVVKINGGTDVATHVRGLNLVTINRSTLVVQESINYDTWAEAYGTQGAQGINDLIAKLNTLDNSVFVALVSSDAIGWSDNLVSALYDYGMSDLPYTETGRYPFAFIGYKGLGKGNGITRMANKAQPSTPVEISMYVANGVLSSQDGQRGKVGRWLNFGGVFDASNNTDTFDVSDVQAPFFLTSNQNNNKTYHVFNYSINGSYTMAQMYAIESNFNNTPWEIVTNDFQYLITKAIFSDQALLGSFAIKGDWMISQHGTINGVASTNYTEFVPAHPNDNIGTNFIPNYAVNALTGNTYQHNGYFEGTIKSTNAEISGKVTANEGKIGPFTINNDGLKVGTAVNWKQATGNFAYVNESVVRIGQYEAYNGNEIAALKVLLGKDSDPNETNPDNYCHSAMFIYRNMLSVTSDNAYKPAVQILSDNTGTNIDVAMRLKGAVQVQNGGVISQGRVLPYNGSTYNVNTLNLTKGTTFVIKDTRSQDAQVAYFYLPTLSEVLTQLGMASDTAFAIPITITAHLDSRGFYLLSPANVYIYDNSGSIMNQISTPDGSCSRLQFYKCYVVRLILISDGSSYYIQMAGSFT